MAKKKTQFSVGLNTAQATQLLILTLQKAGRGAIGSLECVLAKQSPLYAYTFDYEFVGSPHTFSAKVKETAPEKTKNGGAPLETVGHVYAYIDDPPNEQVVCKFFISKSTGKISLILIEV